MGLLGFCPLLEFDLLTTEFFELDDDISGWSTFSMFSLDSYAALSKADFITTSETDTTLALILPTESLDSELPRSFLDRIV